MNNKKKNRRKFSRSNSNQSSQRNSRRDSEADMAPPAKTKVLHTREINSAIYNNNEFRADGIKLKTYEGGTEPLYIGEINTDDIKYFGVLDTNLKRSGVGINFFENGDRCLGFYENDYVNKNGLYCYKPVTEYGQTKTQFYWGQFKNGCKEGRGISLWLTENEGKTFTDLNDDNFDEYFNGASFDCFIGKIEINKMSKGIYLSKKDDKFFVYYGEFDSRQRRKGDNCFYYNAQNDTLMYGKMEKDNFKNAFLGTFDEDGNIKEILQCEYDDDNNLTNHRLENEIDDCETLKKRMSDIRNILLAYDIFGQIYKSFAEAAAFVDKITGTEQFEDSEMYPKIVTKITGYNSINILKEVEDVL